jgi:hypothetical protein
LSLRDGGGRNPNGDHASIHDMVRTKEPGLENMLFYDPQRRASLVERFYGQERLGGRPLGGAKAWDRGDFVGRPFVMQADRAT